MAAPLRILIVEDLEDDVLLLIRFLKRREQPFVYERVDTAQGLTAALGKQDWDLILSDFSMPGFSGHEALKIATQISPLTPFIIVSGAIGEEKAVALVKDGAADYVMKHNLERLPTAIDRALREAHERKLYQEAQDQLKHSEKKFRSLFESAGDAIFFYDLSGEILEANEAACQITGLYKDELLKMNVMHLTPRDVADGFHMRMMKIKGQGAMIYETLLLNKAGRTSPVEVNSRLVEYLGKPVVLSLLRDISERKLAADNLRRALQDAEEARDKIDAILNSVADGLVVTDQTGRIVLINRTAQELLRVELTQVVGQRIDEVILQRTLVKDIFAALNGSDTKGVVEWEDIVPGCKGLQVIQASTSLVTNQQGLETGAIAILRDITRERELDRLKSEFVTTAAHELSTPLATIMGFAELLISQKDLPENVQHESLQYIFEKTETLEKIVDELLNVSRIEFGLQHRLVKQTCILNQSLDRLISNYRKKFPGREFKISLPNEPMKLICDQERLTQALENLLNNAVKFSQQDSAVKVDVKYRNHDYLFTVKDEGVGMSADQVERAFEKFYRGNTADTAAGGLGLGLCIAENIVKAHGGEIHINSEVGKGTTVSFAVPKQVH